MCPLTTPSGTSNGVGFAFAPLSSLTVYLNSEVVLNLSGCAPIKSALRRRFNRMVRMRKYLFLVVAFLAALSVAGCNGAGKGKSPVGKGKAPAVQTRG